MEYKLGVVTKVTAATATTDRYITVAPTTNGVKAGTPTATFKTESFAKGDVVLYTKDSVQGIQSVQLAKSLRSRATL